MLKLFLMPGILLSHFFFSGWPQVSNIFTKVLEALLLNLYLIILCFSFLFFFLQNISVARANTAANVISIVLVRETAGWLLK